jgi:hypothetical protein
MDTCEIDQLMYSDRCARRFYGGTCAIDNIPKRISRPVCYIINTSPSWHPGTHWIAIFKLRSTEEYFCSYGSTPQPELSLLLGQNYTSNNEIVQDLESDLCGQYCILYLLCRCRGYTLSKFLDCFSSNTTQNDQVVADVYENYISKQDQ